MATPWAATRAVNGCIFTRFSSLWMARALPHGALRPHPQAARLLRPPRAADLRHWRISRIMAAARITDTAISSPMDRGERGRSNSAYTWSYTAASYLNTPAFSIGPGAEQDAAASDVKGEGFHQRVFESIVFQLRAHIGQLLRFNAPYGEDDADEIIAARIGLAVISFLLQLAQHARIATGQGFLLRLDGLLAAGIFLRRFPLQHAQIHRPIRVNAHIGFNPFQGVDAAREAHERREGQAQQKDAFFISILLEAMDDDPSRNPVYAVAPKRPIMGRHPYPAQKAWVAPLPCPAWPAFIGSAAMAKGPGGPRRGIERDRPANTL